MTTASGSSSKLAVPLLSCIAASIVLVFLYFAPDFGRNWLQLSLALALPYTVILLLWDTRWKQVSLGIALGTGISYAVPGFLLSVLGLIFGGVGSSVSSKGQLQLLEIALFSILAIVIVVLSLLAREKSGREFLLGTFAAFAYVMWASIIMYRLISPGRF